MKFTTIEFCREAHLDRHTLEVWIEEEWIIPQRAAADMSFSDIDLARARLIHELMNDLGVNAEGVGIVLRLVDQVHGLRSVLAETVAALRAR
jgi:chaperone modulatory protein CbpM